MSTERRHLIYRGKVVLIPAVYRCLIHFNVVKYFDASI